MPDCLNKYNISSNQYYNYAPLEKENRDNRDPVEFLNSYLNVIDCYLYHPDTTRGDMTGSRDIRGLGGGPKSLFEFQVGIDLEKELGEKCLDAKHEACKEKFDACRDACWAKKTSGKSDCVENSCRPAVIKCSTSATKQCQKPLYDKARQFARELKEEESNNVEDKSRQQDGNNAFCQPPDTATQSLNKYGIPIANAQIYSSYSVVEYIQGEVLVKTKDAPRWTPAYKGQRIMIGDEIKTGRNGRCEVKFANSAVFRMRPLSKLDIPNHREAQDCHTNLRKGRLALKFGNIWSKTDPNDPPDWEVRTPTAIAGGSDRWNDDLPRNYVDYRSARKERADRRGVLEKGWDKLKQGLMKIFSKPKTELPFILPKSDVRDSSSYHSNTGSAFAALTNIQEVRAAEGDVILHVSHNEDTNSSQFFVEEGVVTVSDSNKAATVTMAAGDHIAVEPDAAPSGTDVESAEQVAAQWWEEFDDASVFSPWFTFTVLALGITLAVIWVRRRRRKKGPVAGKTSSLIGSRKKKTPFATTKKPQKKKKKGSRKPIGIILAVVVGLVLVFMFSGGDEESDKTISNTKGAGFYYNCKHNYQFEYPAGFTVDDTTHQADSVLVQGKGINAEFTYYASGGESLTNFIDRRKVAIAGEVTQTIDAENGQVFEMQDPGSFVYIWTQGAGFMEMIINGKNFDMENKDANAIVASLDEKSEPSECTTGGSGKNTVRNKAVNVDPTTCQHPNGDVVLWWNEAAQEERDCFEAKYPDSPFLQQ